MNESIPVIILCGGQGTRMRGETAKKKELVTVGGKPIIWHVMRIFSAYQHNRFILTLGYAPEQLKDYFLNYDLYEQDLTIQLGDESGPKQNGVRKHEPWEVNLVDTGLYTDKASRIARVADYIDAPRFFVAYGDDVSDIPLDELYQFHRAHGKLATICSVQVRLPYGVVEADEAGLVSGFKERPLLNHWINGGFMLFEREVLEIMKQGDDVSLEREVLPQLANDGQLMIYRHRGFWHSMNTFKDNQSLEKLWESNPPWKVWD